MAVVLSAASLVAVLAPGHARSLVRVFDGAAWVLSRKKDGSHTTQHLNLASGTPDRSRAFDGAPPRVATVGNMGIAYDPATGDVQLASVDEASLRGAQTRSADSTRVRTVEGDGLAWLLDGATGVAQALVADDSLSVTFSTPVTVLENERELVPKGQSVPAAVDGGRRLWVGLAATGQVVPLEADELALAGKAPSTRRLAPVGVAPSGTPVSVTVIDGRAHAVVGDETGARTLHHVQPGRTVGSAVQLPPGARLAERTAATRDRDGTLRVSVVVPGAVGAQLARIDLEGRVAPQLVDLPSGVDPARLQPPVSTQGATVVVDADRGRLYVVRSDGTTETRDLGGGSRHPDVQLVHGNIIVNDPGSNRVVTVDHKGRSREDRKYPDDAEPRADPPVVPKPETKANPAPLPTAVPVPMKPVPGAGPSIRPGPTVTALGAPGVPTALRAVAGKSSAQLLWAPPASGAAVVGYEITCAPGCPSGVPALNEPASTTSVEVGRLLVDGPRYTFQILAVDAQRRRGPMASFPAVQPVSEVPGPPTCATFTEPDIGSSELIARWTPGPTNGATVDGFTVEAIDPTGIEAPVIVPASGSATSAQVKGLQNGVPYAVSVRANAGGSAGPRCSSVSGIPYGVPGAPTGVTVESLDKSLKIAWNQPDDGGDEIVDATVVVDGEPPTVVTGGKTETSVGGLTNGTSYPVTVTLRNRRGSSAVAKASGKPAGPIGINITNTSSPAERVLRVNFNVDWNGHGSGGCVMVVVGGGTSGGGCGEIDVGGLAHATVYDVRVEVQAGDGLKKSSGTVQGRTQDMEDTITWAAGAAPRFYNSPSFGAPNGAPGKGSKARFKCDRPGASYNFYENGAVAGQTTWWAQISDGRWIPIVYLLGNQESAAYAKDDPRIPNC